MPLYPPPDDPTQPPAYRTLPAGWRGYRISREPYKAGQFNFTKAVSPFTGGRFDSNNGDYGYLYIGSALDVAVAETLIRDIEFPADGSPRAIPRKALADGYYAWVELDADVTLVDMTDHPQLARLAQDTWLTESPSREYPQTRLWADRIRLWAPDAHGFIWRPRHCIGQLSLVLFDDVSGTRPSARGKLICGPKQSLETGRGHIVVKGILGKFSVVLGP